MRKWCYSSCQIRRCPYYQQSVQTTLFSACYATNIQIYFTRYKKSSKIKKHRLSVSMTDTRRNGDNVFAPLLNHGAAYFAQLRQTVDNTSHHLFFGQIEIKKASDYFSLPPPPPPPPFASFPHIKTQLIQIALNALLGCDGSLKWRRMLAKKCLQLHDCYGLFFKLD